MSPIFTRLAHSSYEVPPLRRRAVDPAGRSTAPSPATAWLRISAVRQRTGWSERYVRKLVENGDVATRAEPGPRGFSRRWYARADVERLLAAELNAANRP